MCMSQPVRYPGAFGLSEVDVWTYCLRGRRHILEDTFLLLDALEEDVSSIKTVAPVICLEIGYASNSI